MRFNKYFILILGTIALLGASFCYYANNSTPAEEQVVRIGDNASSQLLKTLKLNLSKAIKEKGLVGALNYCNENAFLLTDSVEKQLPDGVMIKRTSFRTRNMINEPDDDEIKIMKWFENQKAMNNGLSDHYVQIRNYGTYKYYNYYKPLVIEGMCLNCHGEPNIMNPGVVKKIRELYPNDRAMGYKLGDLRGVVHVTIPANLVE